MRPSLFVFVSSSHDSGSDAGGGGCGGGGLTMMRLGGIGTPQLQ